MTSNPIDNSNNDTYNQDQPTDGTTHYNSNQLVPLRVIINIILIARIILNTPKLDIIRTNLPRLNSVLESADQHLGAFSGADLIINTQIGFDKNLFAKLQNRKILAAEL